METEQQGEEMSHSYIHVPPYSYYLHKPNSPSIQHTLQYVGISGGHIPLKYLKLKIYKKGHCINKKPFGMYFIYKLWLYRVQIGSIK